MYVSAGVGGVVTVLQALESRVQSHYFLDTPRTLRVEYIAVRWFREREIDYTSLWMFWQHRVVLFLWEVESRWAASNRDGRNCTSASVSVDY